MHARRCGAGDVVALLVPRKRNILVLSAPALHRLIPFPPSVAGGRSCSCVVDSCCLEEQQTPRMNGLSEPERAGGGVVEVSVERSDTTPAATVAAVVPNAANASKHSNNSSSSIGGGVGSSSSRREGSTGSTGSSRLAAAAALEVLVPPTPPPFRDRVAAGGGGSGGGGIDQGVQTRNSGSHIWGRAGAAVELNGGRPGVTGLPPDGAANPASPPSSNNIELEILVGNEEGGGDCGGGEDHRRVPHHSPTRPSMEFAGGGTSTSPRVQVGSYSIGGAEEWWPPEGDGDCNGDGDGKGSGGDSEEIVGIKPHPRYSSSSSSSSSSGHRSTSGRGGGPKSPSLSVGQGGNDDRGNVNSSGPNAGGLGYGGGSGGNRVGRPDTSSNVVGGVAGATATAAVGKEIGATNGGGTVVMKAVPVSQQEDQQQELPSIGESRLLGERQLERSTTDLQNLQPPSLLRQTSKYMDEDLPLAKRRQNQ